MRREPRRYILKNNLHLVAGMRKTLPNDINARDETAQTPLFDAVASSRLTFSLLWDLLVPDRGSLRHRRARSSLSPGGLATKLIITAV